MSCSWSKKQVKDPQRHGSSVSRLQIRWDNAETAKEGLAIISDIGSATRTSCNNLRLS